MRIADKVFVVTGGGNGIGRALALALLARGASVAALDVSEVSLAETARIADAGRRLSVHAVNLVERTAVAELPGAITAIHSQIDGVVNVAGIIQPFMKIAELDYAEIERVMDVNFWGVVNTTKTFLPVLLDRPEASIVNISSMGALTPVPGQAAYGASKAAVKLFTEALFAELQGTGVTATVVFPGAIRTDITANSGVTMPTMTRVGRRVPEPTSPDEAARRIVVAIEQGHYRVTIGKDVTMLDRFSRLAPRRATLTLAGRMKDLLA